MNDSNSQSSLPIAAQSELDDLIVENEGGTRNPRSKLALQVLLGTALIWSLFQLWIASPLQYYVAGWTNHLVFDFFGDEIDLSISVLNMSKARSLHLAFAVFLAFLAYPAFKHSPRLHIPVIDWVFALGSAFCAMYYFLYYNELANRSGLPTLTDKWVAAFGMLFLLEATRRALGPPLVIIVAILLAYTFFGNADFIPDIIRHEGKSLNKIASHMWLTSEGVFGIALGVSTSFVFLFVLFGALLDKAGAGNYFIKVAFALLGHMRGGPAKAAVLSSGMTGIISGSSIANTVTTGTFTIPLMRRVGFSGEKAGAIEVASSVNGQLMPPVMGAAAFLMVEYVGIPYIDVIKHAFLPAVISYIALLYMVHLEAVKSDMVALPKSHKRTTFQSLILFGITITSIIIFSGIIYYSISWIKEILGNQASAVFIPLTFLAYLGLVKYACSVPELIPDDPNSKIVKLPEIGATAKSGIYYLLPIVVLIWSLMVERLSPGLSAFWATSLMIFILMTHRVFKAYFRGTGMYSMEIRASFNDLIDGLISGARNMIGIGVATAAAGIIVGVVSLTGIGQVLTEVIEAIAGDSLIFTLLLTAVICLVLGMGLPTTANYIVVATLMAHVVQDLGARNGLFVPLIAVHLFVFYFGIMADVTPPVGLASFAAAAISGADPIKTGIQAFTYSIRTALLPFFFIFNTELIMIGVEGFYNVLWVILYSTVAILALSAALQGYCIVRSKFYESIILFFVATMLFIPQIWIDALYPAYQEINIMKMDNVKIDFSPESRLKMQVRGENYYGEIKSFYYYPSVKDGKNISEILNNFGIILRQDKGKKVVDYVKFDSQADKAGVDFENMIEKISLPEKQPGVKIIYIPAILLLLSVLLLQTLRRREVELLEEFS